MDPAATGPFAESGCGGSLRSVPFDADTGGVLTFASVGLLLSGGAVGIRWSVLRVDSLGRRRPFPVISFVLCLAFSLACAVPVIRHARLERRLEAAASVIAGVPMEVHCQSVGEASIDPGPELGFVKYGPDGVPEHKALIKWEACRDLSAWLRSDRLDPSLDQVIAVHVLAHEAMHVAGETDESVTECRAVQRDAALARLLGAGDDAARKLALTYWRVVYPNLTEGYRTATCGPGGALDEGEPDAPWRAMG